MKRLLVLAGAVALAACGSGAGDGESANAAPVPSTAPSQVPVDLVGTYGAQGVNGQAWTTTLAADGSYRNTVAGELTESGSWSKSGDAICFTPTPAAGEAPDQTCQTLVNVTEDGSLVVRDEAGQETTAPRLRSQ
jgi:hypothetical protein